MNSALYIDAFSGAAGDMLLAALVDLGVDSEWLRERLAGLPIGNFDLAFTQITDRGISGKHLVLTIPSQTQYRHLPQIRDIIVAAGYSAYVTENALRAFALLAQAESRVHGCPPEKVHFHEIGAVDTLIDICGFFLALEKLAKPLVYCSPLPMPAGSIRIAHGEYPLPAPAITYLLQGYHVRGTSAEEEMVTPTAAALLAVSAQSLRQWPALRIVGTGFGAGTPGRGPLPNLVRVILGEQDAEYEQIAVIEAQMDDINPEILAHAGELLLSHGALDYFITPVHMKKSRPGFLLTAFCPLERQDDIRRLILVHTSTLGVRFTVNNRQVLPRQSGKVETPYGPVQVKIAFPPDTEPRVAPEYEDCARLAREQNVPLQDIYNAALVAWHQSK